MKKFVAISIGIVLCTLVTLTAKADELKVNVSVENGTSTTKVVGADIYANIDDQLYEITILPDKVPFKMNLKTGALHIKSFWSRDNQIKGE